jgi:hypothetical protein
VLRVQASQEVAYVYTAFSPKVQPSAGKNNYVDLHSRQPILHPLAGAVDTVSREARQVKMFQPKGKNTDSLRVEL